MRQSWISRASLSVGFTQKKTEPMIKNQIAAGP
jgi:hypothetical protein